MIHRTSDINEKEEDMINIYDNDNKNIETKIKPKKHNLSSSLKNFDNNENKENNDNQNLIYNEIYVENKKINENNIEEKEKIIKPKINLYLSKNSLDEQLINREIINDKNLQKNDNIINQVKRTLKSNETEENKNNNDGDGNNNNNDVNDMLDDVLSFEAYGGNETGEDKEQEEIKKSILNSKINLFLSQNSLDDQLVDRNSENKKDENNITNEIK